MRSRSSVARQVIAQRSADRGDPEAARERCLNRGYLPGTRDQFGGMDVSDARKLKALEDENARLKRLLAEQMLDNAMLKDVASRKW